MSAPMEAPKKTVFWGLMVSESMDGTAKQIAKRRGMNLSEFVRYAVNRLLDDYATQPSMDAEAINSGHNLP